MELGDLLTNILHDSFTGTEANERLPVKKSMNNMGKVEEYQITTKQNKAQTVFIFAGIYSIL